MLERLPPPLYYHVVYPTPPESTEYAFLKMRYKLPGKSTSTLITTSIGAKQEYSAINAAPGEARFAASVAAFGQLLRDSAYMKDFSYDDVIELALPVRGDDPFGYRGEFINLVRLARTARTMQAQ